MEAKIESLRSPRPPVKFGMPVWTKTNAFSFTVARANRHAAERHLPSAVPTESAGIIAPPERERSGSEADR
jgi:hypothetical protein